METAIKKKNLKILITDDYRLVRDGLITMLESNKNKYTFDIEETESGEDALKKARENQYDLFIIDYQLSGMNGVETAKKIRKRNPHAKILILSNYDEFAYIMNSINAGMNGYILKNISVEELMKAIDTILSGNSYYSGEVATKIVQYNKSHPPNKKSKLPSLSRREIEIVKLIGKAYTTEEMANMLSVSKKTIESHRYNIFKKLEFKNTVSLMRFIVDNKLF